MRILFFSDNFPPEVNAPASRTFEHARYWASQGHEITVVTCFPNFPHGKIFDGYRNLPWKTEQIDGLKIVRVWSYVAPNSGFALRILDYLTYMVSASIAAFFLPKPDIVIGTSPQLFATCAAWFTAAWRRVPYVFELRDLWPESIKAVGAMKQPRALHWLEKLELFLYRRAALIVAVTNAFKRNLVSRGIEGDKIAVITNGVDLRRFSAIPKNAELVEEHGLGGKFVAGYIGTHGMAHALTTIVDAAEMMAAREDGRDMLFLFIGSGAEKQALADSVRRRGLGNVLMLDSVPKSRVADYWSLLDCSIIHLRNTELFQTVIPSKMFESFAMGRPILLGVRGEAAEILSSADAGLLFEPENPSDLVENLLLLRSEKNLHAKFSSNGTKAARKFDRTVLAAEMLDILEDAHDRCRKRTREL